MARPPWPLIISYEHAVRSKAISLVRKGALLKDALKLAWEDPVVKERHFTTPLCLESNRKRGADFPPSQPSGSSRWEPPAKYAKGGGKGSGKGKKGKGQKKSSSFATTGCASTSPDGQNICYQWNNKASRCNKVKCKFVHICGGCFAKDHPLYNCPHTGGRPK